MPESIDSPYLNKPISHLDHVRETRKPRDSHDEENPFCRLERREPDDEGTRRGDTYEKEEAEANDEKVKKMTTLNKDLTTGNTDELGLVIDVTA